MRARRERGKYYEVIGHTRDGQGYRLGYTSNKWAWIRNANGWKFDQLEFRPKYRQEANA